MITSDGLYTAGTIAGLHTVKASSGGHEAIVEVRVKSENELRPEDDEHVTIEEKPGKRTILWQGAVPTQKWMNFYTKILTRFASSPGLKLEVSFEITLDREQAQSKIDETRAGLKELGLSEDVGMA